jgi:hypothetical protein
MSKPLNKTEHVKAVAHTAWTYLLGVSVVAIPVAFGSKDKPTEMGLAIVAVAIALAFANLDKLEFFKGAGFEARMRKVVDEAYATIEGLRSVARTVIVTNIDLLTWSSRIGGMPLQTQVAQICDSRALCDQLGLHDEQINERFEVFYRMITWDHVKRIVDAASRSLGGLRDEVKQISARVVRDTTDYPDAHWIRSLLKPLTHQFPNEVESAIVAYEKFLKDRTISADAE